MDACLSLSGVCKSFKAFTLRDIGFALPAGYIMGLIGPNGAGKTTTIKLILNMLERDGGHIELFGLDNVAHENTVKQQVGTVFDTSFFVDGWTLRDTEKAIAPFYDSWRHDTFADLAERFGLPGGRKIADFSRGMQMKLMLAVALSHDARLLILDEPTSGLDPVARDELLDILQDYIADGERSVLFSTHITTDLEKVADYITYIRGGELFYTGTRDDLMDAYRLIKGRGEDLTDDLRSCIFGLRETGVGFEGMVACGDIPVGGHFTVDAATLDDIVVYGNKGGKNR